MTGTKSQATDQPMSAKPQLNPAIKLVLDLGPLLLFFFVNSRPALFAPLLKPFLPDALLTGEHAGIFTATAIFIPTILLALAVGYALTRHLPLMPLITAIVVVVFGGLTLILQDETFIKLKPTIIYVLFGGTLLGGLAFGKPLLGLVFDSVFHLTDEGWRKLTLRWALFFLALAVLNEIVWRTQTTDTWVSFKVFGVVPLTFVFAALQYPLLQKYAAPEPAESRMTLVSRTASVNREAIRIQTMSAVLAARYCAERGLYCGHSQRLGDRGLERAFQIIRRDRSDQLVGDLAVAADHERLGHAVDAPLDRSTAVGVGAVRHERIAVAAEEAPRIVGLVLVVDAGDADARVGGELDEQRRLVVARHAPRRPDVEHGHLALERRAVEARHRLAVAIEAGNRRQAGLRRFAADQRGRNARRIAGAEPVHEQRRQCQERQQRQHHDGAPARRRCLAGVVLLDRAHGFTSLARSASPSAPSAGSRPALPGLPSCAAGGGDRARPKGSERRRSRPPPRRTSR